MRAIRTILVGVHDPAAKASTAVEKAAQLAASFGARVELFHSAYLNTYLGLDVFSAELLPQLAASQENRLKRRLEVMAKPLRAAGIEVSTHVSWDFPAAASIVRRASAIRAELIVANCHAGGHRGAWFLRLTDWDLVRYSPIPVLLVKNRRPYHRPCILAAVDPAHAFAKPAKLDTEILRAAALFRKSLHGKLHAVHAYMPTADDAKSMELLEPNVSEIAAARARSQARSRLEPLLRNLQIGRTCRHLLAEHPIDGIPRLADHIQCDIVVMGAVSRSGLKNVFIGNTAERMLDSLSCDVLVVKPPGFVSRIPLASKALPNGRRAVRSAA